MKTESLDVCVVFVQNAYRVQMSQSPDATSLLAEIKSYSQVWKKTESSNFSDVVDSWTGAMCLVVIFSLSLQMTDDQRQAA